MEYDKQELDTIINEQKEISYKDLCNRISIPYKSGNSKIYQLEHINKYIAEIVKVKSKLLITRYRTQDEIDNIETEALTTKAVECILCNELSKLHGNFCTFTYIELFMLLGMINYDYKTCKYYPNQVYEVLEYKDNNTDDLDNYIRDSYNLMRSRITYTLKKLEEYSIIECNDKCYRAFKYSTLPNGDIIIGETIDIPLGSDLHSKAFNCYNEAYELLGINKDIKGWNKITYRLRDVLASKRNILFNKKTSNMYDGFYKCMMITLNKKALKDNYEALRLQLNNQIQVSLMDSKTLNKNCSNKDRLSLFIDITTDINRSYGMKEKVSELLKQNQKENDTNECRDL